MNDLSWMLYLAGTLPNLATGIGAISMIATLIFGIVFIIYLICKSDGTDPDTLETLEPYKHVWIYTIILFLLTFIVPDKNTMYAIAASEMGEEIMKTPIANKATKALEAWIEAQIPEQNKEENNNDQ